MDPRVREDDGVVCTQCFPVHVSRLDVNLDHTLLGRLLLHI